MIFKETLRLAFITLGLLGALTTARPAEVVVKGTAAHLSGKVIRIASYADPISGKVIVHDTDTVSASGDFSLAVNADEPGAYTLAINRYYAPIFLAPGQSYNLRILPAERDVLIDTWQKGALEYAFTELDSTDVNAHILRFEQAYYDFFVQNESLMGSRGMQKAVSAFESSQMSAVEGKGNFLETYVKYEIATMKLALGANKASLYVAYVQNTAINLQNPAWYKFIDQFYGQYFDAYDSQYGGEAMYNRFNRGLTTEGADSLLRLDTLVTGDDMRKLVMLKSVAESLYDAKYPEAPLLDIANRMAETSTDPWSTIAARIVNLHRARTRGIPAGDLGLRFQNAGEAPWANGDTLSTYVFATASWSLEGAKELDLLKSLAQKYPDIVKIAVVYIDGYPADGSSEWVTAYPERAFQYMETLDAYAIPHCFWVNSAGVITREKACLKPSEGLEKTLFKWKTLRDEKLKIKVGQ